MHGLRRSRAYTTDSNDETNEFLSVPSSVSVMRVHCVTTPLAYTRAHLFKSRKFYFVVKESSKNDELQHLMASNRSNTNLSDFLINRSNLNALCN